MLETVSVRPRICDQIRSGPLGRWVDDFVDVLMTRGYATGTVRRYVRAAAIFSAWLDQQRVAATDVNETLEPLAKPAIGRIFFPKRQGEHGQRTGRCVRAAAEPQTRRFRGPPGRL